MMTIADLRLNYTRASFSEDDADFDPISLFSLWFQNALDAKVIEPNAMTLATATATGIPSARIILLKAFDDRGFVFFTNYESRKGQELSENPRAALLFFWPELERQVRVEGIVTKCSREDSVSYFHSRPIGSQLGALASEQSQIIPNRDAIEEALKLLEEKYQDFEIPCPDNWGGYQLAPTLFEFWQGRPNRLHDRIQFRNEHGKWLRDRLAP
jgi:pyridoxamine 5'-phosphate oxidase